MSMTTRYLGLTLAHPFIAGASPLSQHIDTLRQLEDSGAAAVVLHSLFEEQVSSDRSARVSHMDPHDPRFAATLTHFPAADHFPATPAQYLEHVAAARRALGIPVIASINGGSAESWLTIAKDIEQAGAQALELNLYQLVIDPRLASSVVEDEWVRMVQALTRLLTIPVAVKVTPFFTAFASVAHRFVDAGAGGLVLFNRLYQADIDTETMQPHIAVNLSTSQELLLRLRWVAALHGRIGANLAITGGVATATDGIKALLAGANAMQVVSALLREGPQCLGAMTAGLAQWMERHQVISLDDIRGRASLAGQRDPLAIERAAYLRTLGSWH